MRTKYCSHCEQDCSNEQFMLVEHLWKEAMKAFEFDVPYLCVSCVEKVLDKRLNPLDFIFCPLNYDIQYYRSKKLINRLTRFED